MHFNYSYGERWNLKPGTVVWLLKGMPARVVLMTILAGFISILVSKNYRVHQYLYRTYVLILWIWRWIVTSEHTIDLLNIPIYQQMARIVYVDRCMVKWRE